MVLSFDICIALTPNGAVGDTITDTDGNHQGWLLLALSHRIRKGIQELGLYWWTGTFG